jgi:hypothetical protein
MSKTGIGSLFKRAVEAQKEKQGDASAAPVPERMELPTCSGCGAPRKKEELVCAYCGVKLT